MVRGVFLPKIVGTNGEKWVTVKQPAEALEYADHKKLSTLISRNVGEFQGKTCYLTLRYEDQRRRTQLINYRGVIRVAMLSDAPRAAEFRD